MLPLMRIRPAGLPIRLPDWSIAFGRQARLEVDLGCGRGHYAFARALARPERNVVAIESRIKWVGLLRQRAKEQKVLNLRAIRCDASMDLPLLFDKASVEGFSIFHPDPWWKKRHRKRRLVRPELVDQWAQMLTPGGWIFVQTDVPDLAEEAREILSACAKLEALDATDFKREVLDGLGSHREHKCQQFGIPIRAMAFIRKPDPTQ